MMQLKKETQGRRIYRVHQVQAPPSLQHITVGNVSGAISWNGILEQVWDVVSYLIPARLDVCITN